MKHIFQSIRWRLVASYMLLTLLTVSLVGVLALSLAKRYADQQETSYLTANAEAISRRALPLLWPVERRFELADLVQTSSFLSNVRVKILDRDRKALVDSGPRPEIDRLYVVTSHLPPGQAEKRAISLMILPRLGQSGLFFSSEDPPVFQFDEEIALEGRRINIIRFQEDAWGHRLVFDGVPGVKFIPQPDSPHQFKIELGETSSTEQSVDDLAPRSKQVVTVPIGEKDEPVGYVELSSGPNFGAEALVTTRQAFLWAAAGASLIALVVGLLVSRSLTAPLHSLTATAGQMSGGDLSVRASVAGQDEIGQLAGQFNQMAERLEASFAELASERDTLRRFIADASHELRTPIATLRNFNELLQGPAANDPAAQQEFLVESEQQLKRLEWITQNLLNLSRFEAGLITLDLAGCQLADLLETACNAFKAAAQEKQIELSLHLPTKPVSIRCDRTQLEMALTNLLDNALKFTPVGGQVQLGVEVDPTAQAVQVWVQDSGPGIDPADQAHLFERFYRGQNSHGTQGSGLGLAIVQSIVQAHQGRVWVESEPGTGSRFTMELPNDHEE